MISIRHSLGWMFMSQACLFVMQFAVSVIVAKILSPYEMGIFAVAMAIVALVSTLRGLGLSGYVVRAHVLTPELKAAAFTINGLLAIFVSLLILALSSAAGWLLNEPGVRHILALMAVLPLFSVLEFLPGAGLEREGQFQQIAILSVVRALVANGIILATAFAGASYMSLAYGHLVSAAVGMVGIAVLGRRHAAFKIGFHDWQAITVYGSQMLAISGVNVAASRLSELVMGRLLGLDALGLFSRASSLTAMLWDTIHMLIARVVFVDFSEQKRQGRSLRHSYLRIVEMMTALLWPSFLGLAVLAGPFIQLIYGPVWIGAALPLSLLCVAATVLVSITMTWEVFVVAQETARQARFEVVRAMVGFALFSLGCLLSLGAAAAARVLEALFAVGLYRPHLQRMTDSPAAEFWPIYVRSGIPTCFAISPVVVVMSFYRWSPETPLAFLGISVLLGIILWAACLAFTRHPLYDEFIIVFKRILAMSNITRLWRSRD